ncbi:TadE family type IV pilus minor pilin [Actinomycetes bacterium KLBMP 9797]
MSGRRRSGHRFPARGRPPSRGHRPACGGEARGRRDRGSFTAELAAGLPALMLLLFGGLTAVNAVTTKAHCVDAAREAALAAARGEPGVAAGRRAGPPAADVTVTVDGDVVVATVRAAVRPLGVRLPRVTVTANAVAAVEPGAPEPRT